MKKKIFSLTLSLLLIFILSVNAIAENSQETNDTPLPVDVEKPAHDTANPDAEEILNVIIPLTLDFTIDPLEIRGRGQLYSGEVEIENRGDADVLLTFTGISVEFADETDFEALCEPFDEQSESNLKAIYMLLDFGRDDIEPVCVTDTARIEAPAILLGADENDACILSLSGSLNPYPDVDWQDSDVKISLTYQIEAIPLPYDNNPADNEEKDTQTLENINEPDPDSEPEPETEHKAESEPTQESEPESEPESESEPKPESEPEPELESEPESELESPVDGLSGTDIPAASEPDSPSSQDTLDIN